MPRPKTKTIQPKGAPGAMQVIKGGVQPLTPQQQELISMFIEGLRTGSDAAGIGVKMLIVDRLEQRHGKCDTDEKFLDRLTDKDYNWYKNLRDNWKNPPDIQTQQRRKEREALQALRHAAISTFELYEEQCRKCEIPPEP